MLRSTSRFALAIVVAGFLSLSAFAAAAPAQSLGRTVSVSSETGSLSEYLLAIFKSAGISGGIAIINERCQEIPEQFPEFSGTVKEALEKLASMGHQIHWIQVGDSLVVNNTQSLPLLLNVVVREFHFSRNEPLSKVTSGLLDTPEASAEMKELQLKVYGPELGFAQMRHPNTPQDVVTLTDKTVLDALNKIAGNHGVWLYKESRCEQNVMSLNWPIK